MKLKFGSRVNLAEVQLTRAIAILKHLFRDHICSIRDLTIMMLTSILLIVVTQPRQFSGVLSSLPIDYPSYIQNYNSIFNLNGVMSPLNFIGQFLLVLHVPILLIYLSLHIINYVATFLSMAFSIRYLFRKYFTRYSQNSLLPVIFANTLTIPYILNPQFGGAFGYPYLSFLPLIVVTLDYVFADFHTTENRIYIVKSFVLAAVVSLSIQDPRTFVYAIGIVFLFILYDTMRKALFSTTKTTAIQNLHQNVKVTVLFVVFFTLLNIRTIFGYIAIREFGNSIISNAVSSQLGIAFQTLPVLYTITGFANWYQNYDPFQGALLLGLIPIIIGAISLLAKNTRAFSGFLSMIFFIIITLSALPATSYLRYEIGNTVFFPYIVFFYPTFLVSTVVFPLAYLFCTLGIIAASECASRITLTIRLANTPITSVGTTENSLKTSRSRNRTYERSSKCKEHVFKLTFNKSVAILCVVILLSQTFVFYPKVVQISSLSNSEVPRSISGALDFMTKADPTGITYLIITGDSPSDQYLYLLSKSINTPQYSYLTSFLDYVILHRESHVSEILSWYGIEYIVFVLNATNTYSSGQTLAFLNSSTGLLLQYSFYPVYIFKDTNYAPTTYFNSTTEIFDAPLSYIPLSYTNIDSAFLPFYSVEPKQQPTLTKLISGIAGINLDSTDVESLFFKPQWETDIGTLPINQYPSGWQQTPIYWVGDSIASLVCTNQAPLTIHMNAFGDYYLFLLGGVAALNSYIGSGRATVKIVSANTSVFAHFNQTTYSPIPQWTFAGKIGVSGSLTLVSKSVYGYPFISRLVLVPASDYGGLISNSTDFLKTHRIIDFTDSSANSILGVNLTTNLMPGQPAEWILRVNNSVSHKQISYRVGGGKGTNTSSDVGISPFISGSSNSDNGNNVFQRYFFAYAAGTTVSNKGIFGNYSQSPNQISVTDVTTLSNLTYRGWPAVYEPATKQSSIGLWSNFSIDFPSQLSLYFTSTNWGINPGILVYWNNTVASLFDFNGKSYVNGVQTTNPAWKLLDGVWYRLQLSFGLNGSVVEVVTEANNGNSVGISVVRDVPTSFNYHLLIKSDNGNLYWNSMELLYTDDNGTPLELNFSHRISSLGLNNVDSNSSSINALVAVDNTSGMMFNGSNVQFFETAQNHTYPISSYYLGTLNSSLAYIYIAETGTLDYGTSDGSRAVSTQLNYYFSQNNFIEATTVTNSNYSFSFNYGMSEIHVGISTSTAVRSKEVSMLGYEITNAIICLLMTSVIVVLSRKRKNS